MAKQNTPKNPPKPQKEQLSNMPGHRNPPPPPPKDSGSKK